MNYAEIKIYKLKNISSKRHNYIILLYNFELVLQTRKEGDFL